MSDNIKICTWNLCLGARCKLPLIKELILENSIDVLCLQEVEINKHEDLNFYNIENFSVEFEGVTDNFKIRTLIYVSNRIHYRRMTELEKDNNHIISLKLTKQGVILVSLYRTYQLTTHQSHLL
jgi:exonuclease III